MHRIRSLRDELYDTRTTPWPEIPWAKHRNNICPVDMYNPHSTAMVIANKLLNLYEPFADSWVRQWNLLLHRPAVLISQ